jgi:phosphatidylserine/phosphatidylglycerophosphate/cardiolipin synthase-like enzyme
MTSAYEKVELLYTGPKAGAIRRTKQGLLEVVRAARSRLWVVSYVVGWGADEVVTAMAERAGAGVDVKILVDHRTEGGKASLERLAEDASGCTVWVWPDEHREIAPGKLANLHAKCAVSDARRAFVSSANLTGWAMDHNLEVGYLVTGGATPGVLSRYLDELVDADILREYRG